MKEIQNQKKLIKTYFILLLLEGLFIYCSEYDDKVINDKNIQEPKILTEHNCAQEGNDKKKFSLSNYAMRSVNEKHLPIKKRKAKIECSLKAAELSIPTEQYKQYGVNSKEEVGKPVTLDANVYNLRRRFKSTSKGQIPSYSFKKTSTTTESTDREVAIELDIDHSRNHNQTLDEKKLNSLLHTRKKYIRKLKYRKKVIGCESIVSSSEEEKEDVLENEKNSSNEVQTIASSELRQELFENLEYLSDIILEAHSLRLYIISKDILIYSTRAQDLIDAIKLFKSQEKTMLSFKGPCKKLTKKLKAKFYKKKEKLCSISIEIIYPEFINLLRSLNVTKFLFNFTNFFYLAQKKYTKKSLLMLLIESRYHTKKKFISYLFSTEKLNYTSIILRRNIFLMKPKEQEKICKEHIFFMKMKETPSENTIIDFHSIQCVFNNKLQLKNFYKSKLDDCIKLAIQKLLSNKKTKIRRRFAFFEVLRRIIFSNSSYLPEYVQRGPF